MSDAHPPSATTRPPVPGTRRGEAGPGESRSAHRALDLLDLLFEATEPLSLSEISACLDMPKSSAHAILQAMRRRRYVAWNPSAKTYAIGVRVAALARATSVVSAVTAHARPYLERLAERLRETVMVGVYEADAAVCVDRVVSPDRVYYTVGVGEAAALHCTSLGKVYLASLSDDQVRERLESIGMARATDQTNVELDPLLSELEIVRRRGYASNLGESVDGLNAFGAGIFAGGAVPIAGLTVMGPAARIERNAQSIVTELLLAARELSEELAAAG